MLQQLQGLLPCIYVDWQMDNTCPFSHYEHFLSEQQSMDNAGCRKRLFYIHMFVKCSLLSTVDKYIKDWLMHQIKIAVVSRTWPHALSQSRVGAESQHALSQYTGKALSGADILHHCWPSTAWMM